MKDVDLMSQVTVFMENKSTTTEPDEGHVSVRRADHKNTWILKYCITGMGPLGGILGFFQSVTEVFISFNALAVSR
jgi:hypothetical protein